MVRRETLGWKLLWIQSWFEKCSIGFKSYWIHLDLDVLLDSILRIKCKVSAMRPSWQRVNYERDIFFPNIKYTLNHAIIFFFQVYIFYSIKVSSWNSMIKWLHQIQELPQGQNRMAASGHSTSKASNEHESREFFFRGRYSPIAFLMYLELMWLSPRSAPALGAVNRRLNADRQSLFDFQ